MKVKSVPVVLVVFFVVLLFINASVYAQSAQVSNNVNLAHLNVQLTYPAQAQPGQSVTVNVQANAKNEFTLGSLIMQVYVANQNNLVQVASVTLAQDLSMLPGSQINKNIQVAIPQNAARTSMIATISENVTMHVFIIYGQYSVRVQAAPDVTSTSDGAVTPLTYVMATTPEYTTLQNQFQALQSQFTQAQQTLNQTRAQLESQQMQLSQRNATIIQLKKQFNDQLNEQMMYANRRVQTYQGLSLVLGFATAALAFSSVYQRITRPRESEALVESLAKSKQMSDVAESKQMSDVAESKPKRKSNLKKISIAAMVILVIVISAWMAAAYYYGNASTVVQTSANSTATTSQTYTTTTHSSTTAAVHSTTTGTRTSTTTTTHSSTTTAVQTSVTTKT